MGPRENTITGAVCYITTFVQFRGVLVGVVSEQGYRTAHVAVNKLAFCMHVCGHALKTIQQHVWSVNNQASKQPLLGFEFNHRDLNLTGANK